MENETEIWKEVEGYEGIYSVSNLSRVKRHKGFVRIFTNGKEGLRKVKESILTPQFDGRYYHVSLCNKGVKKICLIHRMVGTAFIDNPENKPQVNHKDGIPANNIRENLEWSTQKENVKHALDNGLKKTFYCGERHHLSKLRVQDIVAIKIIYKSGISSNKEIAKLFGIKSPPEVGRIARGERWAKAVQNFENRVVV